MINHKLSLEYLEELKSLLDVFPHDRFEETASMLLSAYDDEKQIFVMGNGGSGSTASHFACDINKGCCFNVEKKFKVICLNDNVPTMLANANDLSSSILPSAVTHPIDCHSTLEAHSPKHIINIFIP